MKLQCPIQKILLPTDGSEHSWRAVYFAGVLGASLGKGLSSLSVLRVITGSYLARHISYIDFRAEVVKEYETFKQIALDHIEKNIKPLMDETETILRDLGYEAQIEKLIRDGDPAREIIQTANEGKFSTIIMARRGLSELKGFLLGSVTNKVVHAASRNTVYIVGQQIEKDKAFPFPKILVPVDGSSYSMKGVEHIACLVADLKASLNKITLLRVINMALLTGRWKKGIDSFDEAREILDKAKETLDKADLPDGLITTKIRLGRPSEEILKEVEEEDYNLIVMGRKGRTVFKDLLLGGVSTAVLYRCQNPTVAIVSNK